MIRISLPLSLKYRRPVSRVFGKVVKKNKFRTPVLQDVWMSLVVVEVFSSVLTEMGPSYVLITNS